MCDPTVLALGSLAIKATGDIMGDRAQNKSAKVNKAAAISSQVNQINDINLRETQEKQAASQQLEIAARQTRTAVSSARLTSGEAGVTGASVDALLTDIGAQGSTYAQDVKINQQNTTRQLERSKLGVYAEMQSRINAVPRANPWATALRIGGDAIGVAAQLKSRKPASG